MLDVVIYVLLAAGALVVVDLLYFGVLEPYRKRRGAMLWWIALLGPFGLAGLLTVIGEPREPGSFPTQGEQRAMMTVAVLVLGGAMLLLSVATGVAATADALRHLPLQFRDDLSARYYMARALFDPSLPWPVRRNLALATVTGILGFLSFAAAAALAGHGTLAVLFLLGGGLAAANVAWQWRSART